MAPRKGEPGRFLYKELAAEFRAQIQSGALAPGDALPSEAALMEERGLARSTVRQAYDLLKAEGLATAKQGKGVFALNPKKVIRNAQKRLSREVWESGRSIWSVDLEGRDPSVEVEVDAEIEAPEYIAGVLDARRVCRRRRVFSLDDRTLQVATSYLDAGLAASAGIGQVDTGPGGMYARLADIGRAPAAAKERIRSRVAMPDEVDVLELGAGSCVIVIERTVTDAEGRILEVNEMTLDAARYILEYDFSL
ncbi:GntR family transcriptional regulator [Streptomyces sp. JS01]|uniref:GntR family transcriptional regulator n=1 Tax=Streptomyces sp. JS01 TaxID=1525753 RepID=UPI000516B759|nr:GntR family transcriptional regulator [Streptomyces sp. JS01]